MAYGNEKLDKRWDIRTVTVPAPAAGAEWTVTVPAGTVWRIRSVMALFTANATVASRQPSLFAKDDAGNIVWVAGTSTTIAASNIDYVVAFPAAAVINSSTGTGNGFTQHTLVLYPIPDGVLQPGAIVGSTTANLQTGDTWTAIALLVEQADAF